MGFLKKFATESQSVDHVFHLESVDSFYISIVDFQYSHFLMLHSFTLHSVTAIFH